jgi:hypothetical protein
VTHQRGEVVWYPAMFAEYDRPFLVVSDGSHPFHGEEYVGLAVTTTAHDRAEPIGTADWELGSLPAESYVKPWNPVILKHPDIEGVAGTLSESCVDRAVAGLLRVCDGT